MFGWVRNPIYIAMIIFAVGLASITPNLPAVVGLAFLIVAIELQVRVVKEPYLLAPHIR